MSSSEDAMLKVDHSVKCVCAWPAYSNRAHNVYTSLLYKPMEDSGISIVEFRLRSVFLNKVDIIHIHWPEMHVNQPSVWRSRIYGQLDKLALSWVKFRGGKVFWTVHNLQPHEIRQPRTVSRYMKWFAANVDGIICLTPASLESAVTRHPLLRDKPSFIVPHGHYIGAYPDHITKQEARKKLGIPPDATVIVNVGQIRAYKNLPALVAAFSAIENANLRLVLAGMGNQEQTAKLEAAAKGDPRIILKLEHVSDDEMQNYFRAADLSVFPYLDILNSGSLLLALSFGVPALVPKKGSMSDLAKIVGDSWVRTYEGDFDASKFQAALTWLEQPRTSQPDLSPFDWSLVSSQTLAAFQSVFGAPKK